MIMPRVRRLRDAQMDSTEVQAADAAAGVTRYRAAGPGGEAFSAASAEITD